ncbi:MAG TPA: hypothetical protein VH328_10740 [Burkholderiaceae bacterium]|jgi:hypothetical protein|nr:hypothetical protein [Burkholderiaceae bacterium]
MTVRFHAALWIVAIALAWLLGTPGLAPPSIQPAVDPEALRHGFALVDAQLMRIQANLLRTLAALISWADLAPVWLPILLAAAIDGLALRRARRCGLLCAPDLSRRWGCHALVVGCFAPILSVSLAAALAPWWIAAWAAGMSCLVAFTLSRVQGLGLRA